MTSKNQTSTLSPKRESLTPASVEDFHRLRARDVTSTEVAALFGLSPYVTPFELWHRKRAGDVAEIESNDRMKWGTRLQDSIAAGLAEDQGWTVRRRPQYERLPDRRLGASFDFTIVGGPQGDGLLEVKNVDSLVLRDEWIVEEDSVEAPPHIEMQVQHQLLVSGLPYAYIGALVGGNRAVLIRREPAPEIVANILVRAEDFWQSVETGKEPKPDFSRDSAFIAKLYRDVKPGRVIDVAEDAEIAELVATYKASKTARDEHEAKRGEVKARLLMKIGDAEKAIGNGWSISAGAVKASRVEAYDRAAYRDFRVNSKKPKKED
ncbi:MAG: YqaJ viral recombinase family protein [Vicinamibacteria bacterium]